MIYVPASTFFEAVTDFGTSGLVGKLTFAITDNQNAYVLGPTAAGISEFPAGSGIYYITEQSPALEGQYTTIWDDGLGNVAIDDLVVTTSALVPVVGAPGSELGPISGWLTGEDVAACCDVSDGSDGSIFDGVAQTAQELLFQLSGRLFPGIGTRTVRPCATRCRFGFQVLSRGHVVGWNGNGAWGWPNGAPCGCSPLSTVHLAGYPVQSITTVKIDGAVVDPVTYRLDEKRFLVRVRDPADPSTVLVWPSCQTLDLPDTETGTFSVRYVFGQNPPQAGIDAAAELACELYKACQSEPCALPKGVTRVARQGITVEKPAFASWIAGEGWKTGMAQVDAFLSAFNPSGLKRRPIFWSPASHLRYARPLG